MPSSCIHFATNSIISFFFYGWVIVHCVYTPHLLYPFLCWWTFRLFSCLLWIVLLWALGCMYLYEFVDFRLLNASRPSAPSQPVILVNGIILAPSPLTPKQTSTLGNWAAVFLQSLLSGPHHPAWGVGVYFQSLWRDFPIPALPLLICPSHYCETNGPPMWTCCVHSGICSALYDLAFAYFCSLPICKITSDFPVVKPNGDFSVLNLLDL